MPKAAKRGVNLSYADSVRVCAWAKGTYTKRDPYDWDPVTKSWPASIRGTCRHKCEWMKERLGGEILVGRRTDKRNSELHAVLLLEIHGYEFVLDQDGVWPAKGFPFSRVEWPPPAPPEPEKRTWPWPWFEHPT